MCWTQKIIKKHADGIVDLDKLKYLKKYSNIKSLKKILSIDTKCCICKTPINGAVIVREPKTQRRAAVLVNRETFKSFTLDHFFPKAFGGSNAKWNLQVMCEPCNQAKGNQLPI